MLEILLKPWPWYVAGPLISSVMFMLIYFGDNFGVSSNLRTLCSIGGAGKVTDFFRIDKRSQLWNLTFVFGSILGGFIAIQYLTPDEAIRLNGVTVDKLSSLGIGMSGHFLPTEIFGQERLTSVSGLALLLGGGFLVGFGSRYAGGCTSGHAISGLSNLQIPSLIAVVGFFIGGLAMVHLIMPYIF